MGMDAEVVAKCLEVAHTSVIEKLGGRRGEMGWRFMEKFVQLPFILPPIDRDQYQSYLDSLFGAGFKQEVSGDEETIVEAVTKAKKIKQRLGKKISMSAKDMINLFNDYAKIKIEESDHDWEREDEEILSAAAKRYQDDDPHIMQQLMKVRAYLSDNPRTIKRFINLIRFQLFISWARNIRGGKAHATLNQITRWNVVIIRWPSFVRWIQCSGDSTDESCEGALSLKYVIKLARDTESVADWSAELGKKGVAHSGWGDDKELWDFLREKIDADLELEHASKRGYW